uniref:Ig-like domain-containing protein n=1 Tax=Knipowitschia caucasica TaxID=637954 RepID=A0AAV2LCE0_KNICA
MSDASDSSSGLHSRKPKVVSKNSTSPQEPTAPAFTRKLRKAAVGTGCDIRLRVCVTGQPTPALSWYHNEQPLPPSEAQDAGGLWIRDCRTTHAGLYTCVASNALGEARCSAVLAVMDLGEGKHQLKQTHLTKC